MSSMVPTRQRDLHRRRLGAPLRSAAPSAADQNAGLPLPCFVSRDGLRVHGLRPGCRLRSCARGEPTRPRRFVVPLSLLIRSG